MAIINYTTKISAAKTIGEIQELLAKNGATKITCDYNDGVPCAITFGIPVGDSPLYFELPANFDGVLKAMQNDKTIKRAFCAKEQAVRVAWRIILNWIEAQCAIIEAGQSEMTQVFLPYLITVNGQTLYKNLKEKQFLLK